MKPVYLLSFSLLADFLRFTGANNNGVCDIRSFQQIYRNARITSIFTSVLQVSEEMDCMTHCVQTIHCQSFNYQYDVEKGLCELSNITLKMCPAKRQEKQGFAYYKNTEPQDGSAENPGTTCDGLKDVVGQQSGEYWVIYQCQTFKVRCLYGENLPNIALGKPTAQSSTHRSHVSSKAVDGNRNTSLFLQGCTHTEMPDKPWWRVDLQENYFIRHLNITNRGDCCYERLSNFEIRIGSSLVNNGNDNAVCGGQYSLGNGETRNISCPTPMLGRYVNIVIPGVNKFLTLCEVEVYP